MRHTFILLIAISLFACDTKLSDEQRKAFKEEMENREPKKIGEEDVYKATLEAGQTVIHRLAEEIPLSKVASDCDCVIKFTTSTEGLDGKELQLFELYNETPNAPENVQKDGANHLIYSVGEVVNDTLSRVWMVRFERRNIVLSL